jgi:Ca2+-binding RTX toxin-like protein
MLAKTYHSIARQSKQPLNAGLMAILVAMTNVGVSPSQAAVAINSSPIGNGFTVTEADLAYILKQIKIAEYHAANTTLETGPCGALVGTGPNQIASPLLSFGLRTVDGTCNNLQPGQENFGAADQPFTRLTTPEFKPAENATQFGGPPQSSYAQETGSVVDSRPRLISNLIVDQTSSNPAAIFVSGNPSRTQGNTGVLPCTTEPTSIGVNDGVPAGCVPAHETLFMPNVTTDVGLSPPYNSLFTIFGQFFSHGLDKITTGGAGTVFVTLKADDPLVAGPDHVFGSPDDLGTRLRFMAVTRGTNVTDADGNRNSRNTDTPFVDQSQTYSSHGSHQVFMREYVLVDGKPVTTGKLLSDADGGMANWAMIKEQAATKLGIQLVDVDVNNIPLIATDPYGNFIPGPNGLPQIAISSGTGLVEGNLIAPVAVPQDGVRINAAFLNDIAHSADPGSIATPKTPDANTAAGGSLDRAASGEYDNELLDLHFICGDGRCNENIGLTAIHQTFHMEHDRLVDYFINSTDGVLTRPENAALLAEFMRVNLTPTNLGDKTFTYSERLFQAARFINEMEYQHLVFEEFARKIQPMIAPFPVFAFNQTDINPAITAEFAHAVYRFGHSMLTESVPRVNPASAVALGAPLHNDISLLDGFLNPAELFNGGGDVKLTTRQGVSSLIMGLSDQVGNELDEFVTEVLRNHLLGLPLDLAAINIARARSEGVPSLNKVRKQLWAATNDTQLIPYANWVDFNENIKNPVSLVNFIAAYGKHPSILAATTLADKRAAADQLVNGTVRTVNGVQIKPPADSANFMFSISAWEDVAGVSQTGLDDIDLWMGGLAEKTNVFGGLLGSTFNYVFEKQLSDLQLGDRFYYLARTPGMNLRTQLEGNSFSELIMRNTSPDTHTLKADSFATADCKFQLANLNGTAAGFLALGSFVADDPTSECDESKLLIRFPDGAIKYRLSNQIDPAGLNGQSVFNGTDFADYIAGGNDNDTFWGGLGNDNIQGNGGDDFILGGEGDDILTDSAGFDFLKGGPGNDAMDSGIDDDILVGGDGQDFMNGGANNDALFGGPGDDFMIGGQGSDVSIGDSGDDWVQGGEMQDLLIGDSSTFFFDDRNRPGHDIFIGQGGDDDYDMEGGDDIAVAGPGVEKNAGAAGYDWSIGLGDPQPQDADLALKIVETLPLNEVRNGYDEVEALSGWKLNDTLRGDSVVPSQVSGLNTLGCNVLDQAGLNRIAGLDELVPPLTVDPAPIIASATTSYCELLGPVWGEGNIILGGGGSDTLEGRGADDILDGDKYLNVRLSVRAGVDVNGKPTGAELGSTGLMEALPVSGNYGFGTTGMTLQQAVFSGRVNPGQIVAVREILNGGLAGDIDTAFFSGPAAGYSIIINGDGSVTVRDNNLVARDGTDTLWNMEQLSFCAVPDPVVKGACITRAAAISIVPVAVVSPTSLAFGNQLINTTSASRPFTVSNSGLKPLTLSSIGVVPATDFGIAGVGTTCTATTVLVTGSSCTVSAQFSPTSVGAKSASVSIVSNTSGSPISVSLTGIGVLPIPPSVPSTVVDNFNRANATKLGGDWQQTSISGVAVLRVNANQAFANFGFAGSSYYTTLGGATQAAGFTFANTTVNNTALYLKATGTIGIGSGQLKNAIRVQYNNGNVTVSTTTNNGSTYSTAGVASSGVLANGNSLKAVVDDTGKVWVWKVVGASTTLLTPTGVQLPSNALWTTGAGKVGMLLPDKGGVDDFVKS